MGNEKQAWVAGDTAEAPQPPRTHAVTRPKNAHRLVPALLGLCLLLAIGCVLFVPLLVGGALPASSKIRSAEPGEAVQQEPVQLASYSSLEAACEELGYTPEVPDAVPEGYSLTAIRVVEGDILEMEYTAGRSRFLYRTAKGNDDLTGDLTEYSYTVTEERDGVARSYAGVAEKKLNHAVWANGESSFAVVASDGIDNASMRLVAESIG